ncbi:site-specific integrase [Acinetobacter baumannii]|uniref:site-specific integrase n=1 Tax=Acinetobacter baumannii TaxID=470 RepID=UPI00201CE0DB|nr:site-specific integrase [Acinetobacter baumannii]MCL6695270.1 site-specific integrase [Acinetobacter baumannii]
MKNKVYSLQNDVALFDYYSFSKEKPIFLQKQNIPFLVYPNGIPCFEANAYMVHLLKQNLSTLQGGSLLTYATLISHFIKFYYSLNPKCLFTNLNNNHFTNFIHSLSSDKRSSRQICRIGKQTIDFLIFVSDLYSKPSLIGVGNNFQIKLILSKKSSRKKNPYKDKPIYSFTHSSFPTNHLHNPQSPISLAHINKLREQIRKNKNYDCVLRNLCILDLFQITGARRSEAIFLTVEDVYHALNSDDSVPLLTLRTLKRRDSITHRKIPVPKNFLLNVSRYIRNIRNKIILKKGIKDHGFVFISHTTGKKISSDTLTTYLNNWSHDANISPPCTCSPISS